MNSLTVARSTWGSLGMLAMDRLLASSTNEKAAAAGVPSDPTAAPARELIEALTNDLHAPDVDGLTDAERSDFRDLAKAARAHASTKKEG